MSKNKSPVSVNLREDHKEWMDAENINRSSLINELITQYRNGPTQAEYAAKEYRKQQLQTDIAQAKTTIETKQEQLERIESELSKLKEKESKQNRKEIETAAKALDVTELKSTGVYIADSDEHIKQEAERVGCTPEELKDVAIQMYKGEYNEWFRQNNPWWD